MLWNYFDLGLAGVVYGYLFSRALAALFVQLSGICCVILVEGIPRNNSVNLFWNWTCGLGGDVVSGALAALLFCGAELFMQILYRALWGTIPWYYFEFGPVIQEEMWFQDLFSSRAPASPLFSGAEPFVQFWQKTLQGTILWNCFEFGVVIQDEMSFKDISYLELWRPLGQRNRTICAIL